MTDHELAVALLDATKLEAVARISVASSTATDRGAAQTVLRHTVALKLSLERWIGTRVVRAQLHAG